MHRTSLRALVALPLILAVALSACGGGGDDSAAEVKAKVATEIAKEGLTEKDAECFAGVLVDEIGIEKLKDVDFSAEEPPAGLEDELTAASIKALATCKIDMAEQNG